MFSSLVRGDSATLIEGFESHSTLSEVNVLLNSQQLYLLVAQSVMCHLTFSYGFQVCGDDSVLQKKFTSISWWNKSSL